MKLLLASFGIIFGLCQFVFAAPKTLSVAPFKCETELPTTTYELKSVNGGNFEFSVNHHFGLKNIPVALGVVTMNDFAVLQAKGEVLQKLGDSFTLPIKAADCESFGPELYSCYSRDPIEINGTKVSGYNFTTRVVNKKVYDYDFKSQEVVFSFFYEGVSYDMPMSYAPEECKFNMQLNK